jgi:hypothetical protein
LSDSNAILEVGLRLPIKIKNATQEVTKISAAAVLLIQVNAD